jgi:hypothetical protein
MPRKYSPYPFKDIGLGIDTYSPKDKIPEGALSDVLNMDPEANSTLSTRKGYARYYGNIPLRILSAEYVAPEEGVGAKWRFQIDSAQTVSLLGASYSPLAISGYLQNVSEAYDPESHTLDFASSFTSNWYPTFFNPFEEFFEIPSGTNEGEKTKTVEDTGVISSDVVFGVAGIQPNTANKGIEYLRFTESSVTDAGEINIKYELYNQSILTEGGFNGYFFYKEYFEIPGEEYVHRVDEESAEWQFFDNAWKITIENNVHNLNTLNFVVDCHVWDEDTQLWIPIPPQQMYIDRTAGSLTVELLEKAKLKVLMSAVSDGSNVTILSAPGEEDSPWTAVEGEYNTYTTTIENVDNPFNFVGVWVQSDDLLYSAIEASVEHNADTKELTITYTHPDGGEGVRIFLLGAAFKANVIEVEALDSTYPTSFVDNFPLLTLWGISHDNLYREAAFRGGYTHHLDKYASSEKTSVVSGLGGNLFEALSFEQDVTSEYGMPSRTVRGSSRVIGAQTLAPRFGITNNSLIKLDQAIEIKEGTVTKEVWVRVNKVTVSGENAVYYLSTGQSLEAYVPSDAQQDAGYTDINDLLDILIGEKITVQGCSFSVNNGAFDIIGAFADGTDILVTAKNLKAKAESGILAKANVFYSDLEVSSDDLCIVPGHIITKGSALSNFEVAAVEAENGEAILTLKNIKKEETFSDGINVHIIKKSSIFPLALGANANAEGFVKGDVVDITGYTRKFTVKQVFSFTPPEVWDGRFLVEANSEGYFEIDFETAFGEGAVHGLNAGDSIIVTDADPKPDYDPDVGYLDGEWILDDATDRRHLRFGRSVYSQIVADSDAPFQAQVILVNNTIELDEAIQIVAGPSPIIIKPEGRWVTVENPISRSTDVRLPAKNVRHFDENPYSNQPYVKSTIVKNSLYLSNNDDEVKKFDGKYIYNAGLPSFQPWAFLSVDTSNKALSGGQNVTYDKELVSYDNNYFILENASVAVGSKLQHTETKQIFTVADTVPIGDDRLKVFVKEDTPIEGLKSKVELQAGTDYQEILSESQSFDFKNEAGVSLKVTPLDDGDVEEYTVKYSNKPEYYYNSLQHLDIQIGVTPDIRRYEAKITEDRAEGEARPKIIVYVPFNTGNNNKVKAKLYPEIEAGDKVYYTTNIDVTDVVWTEFSAGEEKDLDLSDSTTSSTQGIKVVDPTGTNTREYDLKVETVEQGDATIPEFYIGDNVAYIDETAKTIDITVPYGTTITSLIPHFIFKGKEVKVGEAIQYTHITAQDFSSAVSYVVYPNTGDPVTYTVSVTVASIDFSLSDGKNVARGGFITKADGIDISVVGEPTQRNTALTPIFTTEYAQGELVKASFYRYYARLNAVDRNNQKISSAFFGADDMYIDVFESGSIQLKLLTPPAFSELEHSRIELSLYRTFENSVTGFRRVYSGLAKYEANTGYITHLDTVPDDALVLADEDRFQAVVLGGELGNRWAPPPKAKVMTTADNRLILGNITSPPLLDVTFKRASGSTITNDEMLTKFNGNTFTIKRVAGTDLGIEDEITLEFIYNDANNSASFSADQVDSVTITKAHTLVEGDWVYLFHSSKGVDNDVRWSGWYKVDSATDDDFTIKVEDASAYTEKDVDSVVWPTTAGNIPVWLGEDGNFNQRREEDLTIVTRAASRMSVAINAVMATLDASTNPPWLLARSGQSYPNGNIVLEQAGDLNGTMSMRHSFEDDGEDDGDVEVYNNNLLVAANASSDSEVFRYNSRLALSYRNFPEIFDDPYNFEDDISSIIDINPADGQEITAAVPFFGSSAFGSAQLAQAVVVFKTNSVYLVDIASNSVQKLQTQGQGCTAPRSVAVTKNGIFFANESGVYRLGTDMKIIWMGKALDGKWNNELNKSLIEEMAGHNYAQERRYKLSYPIKGSGVNSHVAVYDSAKEEEDKIGSWTIYDNHPSTGWCNLKSDAFFGGLDGRVYRVRNDGTKYDYRDDASPIFQYAIFGATHFGMPDERKITESVTLQFQNEFGAVTGIKLLTEQSLSGTFNASGTITIPEDAAEKAEGDEKRQDTTVRFSLPQRKGTHVRAKIEKEAVLDEKLQLSSLTYGVRPTGADGVPQANKYRS